MNPRNGSLRTSVLLLPVLLVLLLGTVTGGEKPQLLILTAQADQTSETILIQGENFLGASEGDVVVKLAGTPLTLIPQRVSDTEIWAELPAGVVPGTYLLTVSRGTGSRKNDAFNLTIGAVGPEGPPGQEGMNGAPGLNGVPGLNGLSVTSVPLPAGDPNCPTGGSQFTSANGVTYSCNGAQGAPGTVKRAAPPCRPQSGNFDRYVDCGNGTVTDTVTGLLWLQDGRCFGHGDWWTISDRAAALADGQCGLTDSSSPGDWRLPTKEEWMATVAAAVALGCQGYEPHPRPPYKDAPSLTDDAGTSCWIERFSGRGASLWPEWPPLNHWSSSTDEALPDRAWTIYLIYGNVDSQRKLISAFNGWPVRAGR